MPNGSSTSHGPVIFYRKILPPVKLLTDERRTSGEALSEAEKGNHDSKKTTCLLPKVAHSLPQPQFIVNIINNV